MTRPTCETPICRHGCGYTGWSGHMNEDGFECGPCWTKRLEAERSQTSTVPDIIKPEHECDYWSGWMDGQVEGNRSLTQNLACAEAAEKAAKECVTKIEHERDEVRNILEQVKRGRDREVMDRNREIDSITELLGKEKLRADSLLSALKGCLDAMFMQERRECEDFHLSPAAARHVWDKARDDAGVAYLAALAAPASPATATKMDSSCGHGCQQTETINASTSGDNLDNHNEEKK